MFVFAELKLALTPRLTQTFVEEQIICQTTNFLDMTNSDYLFQISDDKIKLLLQGSFLYRTTNIQCGGHS